MSLLLDALKKSEAQRRRGTSPTIDLTRTPQSTNRRRPASHWLLLLLACVLLVAAAPWLWPHVSGWIEDRRGGAGEAGQLAEVTNTASSDAGLESPSRSDTQAGTSERRTAPAPVAGASSTRRVIADSGAVVGVGKAPESSSGDLQRNSGDSPESPVAAASSTDNGAGPDNASAESKDAVAASVSEAAPSMEELRPVMQARQQQQQAQPSQPAEPPAQPNQPAENFIRPWELPQARRAEFPALSLTVHFYAERPAERFVLINGERYREGQRVGPGTRLVEIRKRGAVVEFGSYRVLIE